MDVVDGWGVMWEYGGVYLVSGKEERMVKMSAGQWVVEVLRSQGVRYVYGVVGSAFLEIMDAMYGLEDIEYVGTRHEQGAAFMALGYAHATGKPGVCLVTNGPGATNLVTGVAGAYVTHAPMVAMIGGISQDHMGRGSFQEVDHVGVFRPVAKASVMTPNAGRIPDTLLHAFRVATSGKMGPVVVDIPRDIQNDTEVEADERMLGPVRQDHASGGGPCAAATGRGSFAGRQVSRDSRRWGSEVEPGPRGGLRSGGSAVGADGGFVRAGGLGS